MKFLRTLPTDRRRSIYLFGVCLSGIGVLLILSAVVTVAANFGNLAVLRHRLGSIAFRAITGTLTAGVGFGAMAYGSHVELTNGNPHENEQVEFSRRSDRDRELLRREGEVDANIFDNPRRFPMLPLSLRGAPAEPSEKTASSSASIPRDIGGERIVEVVKVRCRVCRKLSAQEANYCEHCGRAL